MRSETTLYMIDAEVMSSRTELEADAERRAHERGCECIRPTFRHYMPAPSSSTTYVCIVDHFAYCPLAPIEATS